MFGASCWFRDTRGLAAAWDVQRGGELNLIEMSQLIDRRWPIVAVENTPEATIVFGATLPTAQSSIVVGGERLGIRTDLLRVALRTVQIPMSGRGVNTLNVAAAAAVALYYLLSGGRLAPRQAKRPDERRPALLLWRPTDHVEVGSAIRSAAAFGWRTIGLEDPKRVWFGARRGVIAEGRAAARAHRNLTRVLPMTTGGKSGFRRVVVAGARIDGPPIHSVDLARRDTLLVIPDEGNGQAPNFNGLDSPVEPAQVHLTVPAFPYRFRLISTIIIAEAARQIGLRPLGQPRLRARRGLTYESALSMVAPGPADEIDAAALMLY